MSQAEWRRKNFEAKFTSAAHELGVAKPSEVESLKFRDQAGYGLMHDSFFEGGRIQTEEVDGDYQGRAWKLTDADGHSILAVEHETGLEILYVAGSVASLLGLGYLVAKLAIDHWPPIPARFRRAGLEKRRLSDEGQLIEEPAPPIEMIVVEAMLSQQNDITHRMQCLEAQVDSLVTLVERIAKPEQQEPD